MISTKRRSCREEIMDDFSMQGEELEKTLLDLDKVNRWLGGNQITVQGVKKIINSVNYKEPVKIIDVGCGNGSIIKEVAQWGRKKGIKMELLGLDANPHAMEIAEKNLKDYPEATFKAMDVLSPEFELLQADVILCTLTLHHFKDGEIVRLMHRFSKMANFGVVINDLQRSKAAFYLFKVFCRAFNIREINREDGLTSILRSFKKEELKNYGKDLPVNRQEINWKWAFRYQWILCKK